MDSFSTSGSPSGGLRPIADRLFRPRRRFLTRALGLGAGAVVLGGTDRDAIAQVPGISDPAIVNFALNFDYLASEYATLGVTGASIEALGISTTGANTGGGNPGPITVKANPKVPFTTPEGEDFANELAVHERVHVVFLRKTLAGLGIQPVARPALDLLNSFNALAAMAGLGAAFDPFASEVNFLLGSYIIEDVALTALNGAAPLIRNKNILNAAAGLLGIEGYHSAVIRTNLYQQGQGPATQALSQVREALGDSTDYGVAQGPLDMGPAGSSSVVLADSRAIAPARTFRQVLNIAYGAVDAAAGGFFPLGLNGPIR